MRQSIRQAYDILDPATRRLLPLVTVSFLLLSLMEALGIGLVFPLMLVLMDPDKLTQVPFVARLAVVGDGRESVAFGLAGVIGLLFIVKSVAAAALTQWQFRTLSNAEADVGVRLFTRYLASPWPSVSSRNSSELIRNASVSATQAFAAFVVPSITLVTEAILTAAILGLLLLVDTGVALAALLVLGGASGGYYALVRGPLARTGRDFQTASLDLLNHLKQGLGAGREIRILGRPGVFISRVRSARTLYADAQTRRNVLSTMPRYVLEVILVLAVLVGMAVAIRTQGLSGAGPVMAVFGVAALRLMTSANRLLGAIQQLRVGAASLAAVHEDLLGPSLAADPPAAPALPTRGRPALVLPGIALAGVSFAYSADRAALQDIDLQIAWGESVGIVGPSGSGKSTLIDLILGLLRPSEGSMSVDGLTIEGAQGAWRQRVGYVPQTIYLTDDTIGRNVAFGVPDAEIDPGKLALAVERAQLTALLAELPHGLDTPIGELGNLLSGGQRQRIGIARSLYHDPDVLILDEATTALDNETENALVETIDGLKGEKTLKTLIVVAHRLTTVRRCNRIIFLKDGRVASSGTFADLTAQDAEFEKFVRLGALQTGKSLE